MDPDLDPQVAHNERFSEKTDKKFKDSRWTIANDEDEYKEKERKRRDSGMNLFT
jgi:hypothetical protein